MLIELNKAAGLAGVESRTLYRYTFPRNKDTPPTITRYPQGDFWAVDSRDLTRVFPSRAYLVERHVEQAMETTYSFLEEKLNDAVESKNWSLASNITETLKTLTTE